jgi:hypothetical protein
MTKTIRLLQLALKGLEAERRKIDEEISDIHRQLRNGGSRLAAASSVKSARTSRLTPAGRKALSESMKRRWAERRKAQARQK